MKINFRHLITGHLTKVTNNIKQPYLIVKLYMVCVVYILRVYSLLEFKRK